MVSIPTFENGTELRKVRSETINPMVDVLNERFQDVIPAGQGKKCMVDYRKYDLTNPSGDAFVDFVVPLDANEYPVRGVISTISSGDELYVPCDEMSYNRTTNTLRVDVDAVKDGHLYIEFWKELP